MTPKGRVPNARASSAQLKMLFREGSTPHGQTDVPHLRGNRLTR